MSSPPDNAGEDGPETVAEDAASVAPTWRFLVDENLPRYVAERLRAESYIAEHVVEIGLRGYTDADVFAHAQQEQQTIVTTDIGFGNVLHYPPPHAGIIVVRLPDNVSILRRTELIVGALKQLLQTVLNDSLITVEVGRVRVRKRP